MPVNGPFEIVDTTENIETNIKKTDDKSNWRCKSIHDKIYINK